MPIDKKIKVKKLNTNTLGLVLPKQGSTSNDGVVGKFYENHLLRQGFKMNSGHGVDIPGLNIETKTRKRGSRAMHTIGTMTYDNIINTPYQKSTVCQKLQQQQRMEYNNDFQTVVHEAVYDFRVSAIQKKLEESYETARDMLRQQGAPEPGTVVGGQYGVFEWKNGNTYAYRIPDSGMKKLLAIATATATGLFDWGD